MSELTTPIKIEIPGVGTIESADLYLKSEADKVIADLIEKNKCLARKDLIRANVFKEIRRYKYKRCLDMSRWCDTKADWYYSISGFSESFRDRVDFYIKWRDKWREIAEKLRHNDSTTMPKAPEYGERNCKNCLQCYELEDKDTFYKVFCKQAGHWMDWYKEYNCTQFIPKEEK